MTLCAAWIRQIQSEEQQELIFVTDSRVPNDEGQELIFVTDSRLSGGEAWDSGLKLFDLGRTDSLLCFTGHTRRAYPLILNANNASRLRNSWSDPRLDLHEVLDIVCSVFTDVCNMIKDVPARTDVLIGDDRADFLFGGWSWRQQRFCIWQLNYSPTLKAYTPKAIHSNQQGSQTVTFLGDRVEQAERLLEEELRRSRGGIFRNALDMEPLRVVATMSRDPDLALYSIGGSLQIAKVYKSGHNEFFGVKWREEMTFLGQKVNPYDAPPIRFLDPDTTEFIGGLPTSFTDLELYDFGSEAGFVQRCYPDKKLKSPLTEEERKRLFRIFQEEAYREFLARREVAAVSASEATVQEQDAQSTDEPPAEEV
jgi:hypothetical protein